MWPVPGNDALSYGMAKGLRPVSQCCCVTQGDREVNRAKAVEYGLRNVLIQEGREIASAYNVLGTPSAVLVLPSGEVGNQTVGGVEAITQLVKDSVANAPDNLAMALSGSKGQGRPGFRYERLDEEAI